MRLRRDLAAAPPDGSTRRLLRLVDDLSRTLRPLHPRARRLALAGSDLRGFLAGAELWLGALRLASRASRRSLPGARRRAAIAALFDRITRTEHLVAVVPEGRLDSRFPARAGRVARARLEEIGDDLAAALVGLRLAHPAGRPFSASLSFREEPEQGRPARRIDLGVVETDEGALAIEPRRQRAARPRRPDAVRRRIPARVVWRTLRLGSPGTGAAVFPQAGSRLRTSGSGRDDAGSIGETSWRLVRRERIPGSSILIAPALLSSARRLRVGEPVRALGPRLARALRIVRAAWPEAHREIASRTRMIVPVRERGLVSYSLAARPGISFINVRGKSLLELADDLLHETAHHRLHDIEEVSPLLRRGAAAGETQAFESPWRGTRRPLRGLLHGTYTFLVRAELFLRILQIARERPGLEGGRFRGGGARWLQSEAMREIRAVGGALADLAGAARSGLMTGEGRRLLRALRRRHATLRALAGRTRSGRA